MRQIVRINAVIEALGGGALTYSNNLDTSEWLVIKKADYENLLKLLKDSKNSARPVHDNILKHLGEGKPLPIQELILRTGAGHGSVNSTLIMLMNQGLVVRRRFRDPDWPFHANIGRWLYYLSDKNHD